MISAQRHTEPAKLTKNVEEARQATLVAISELDRAAAKGVIHKNNAARRKSRLMKHLHELESQQSA